MRLQSDVAQLQRELHALHERLQAEHKLQQSLEQQLREVQRARLADSQAGQWQLGAVKLYTNRIVQAAPVGVSVGCVSWCRSPLAKCVGQTPTATHYAVELCTGY